METTAPTSHSQAVLGDEMSDPLTATIRALKGEVAQVQEEIACAVRSIRKARRTGDVVAILHSRIAGGYFDPDWDGADPNSYGAPLPPVFHPHRETAALQHKIVEFHQEMAAAVRLLRAGAPYADVETLLLACLEGVDWDPYPLTLRDKIERRRFLVTTVNAALALAEPSGVRRVVTAEDDGSTQLTVFPDSEEATNLSLAHLADCAALLTASGWICIPGRFSLHTIMLTAPHCAS